MTLKSYAEMVRCPQWLGKIGTSRLLYFLMVLLSLCHVGAGKKHGGLRKLSDEGNIGVRGGDENFSVLEGMNFKATDVVVVSDSKHMNGEENSKEAAATSDIITQQDLIDLGMNETDDPEEDFITENGFPGLAMICIDYRVLDSTTNKIEFKSSTKARDDGKNAIFVKNIKHVGWEAGWETHVKEHYRILHADMLTPQEAKEFFEEENGPGKVPLFSIHGFNVLPGQALKQAYDDMGGKIKTTKNIIVPVLWPNEGRILNYGYDQKENAPISGKKLALGALGKMKYDNSDEDVFPVKNLFVHSMGNLVLRNMAREVIWHHFHTQFDNIVMHAADVRHDLFHEEYINSNHREGTEEYDGIAIFRMLKRFPDGGPLGKLYFFTNWDDGPLEWSGNLNLINRLGQSGNSMYDKWIGGWGYDASLCHPVIRDYYENYDALPKLYAIDKNSHYYVFMDFSVDWMKENIPEFA